MSLKYQNYPDIIDGNFFSAMKPEEEFIQPVPLGASHEWTETSMFGFNIPEHGIDCIFYFWHHPALNITSGGVTIWKGRNINQVECEYSDYRLAMPMPADQTNCTYANGISVRMIKPLEEFEIRFSNPDRNTSVELHLRAIMPPACRHNGGHITQAMKTSGTLVLNGTRYTIDGYHSRDRSWNESRSEASLPLSPISWTVGIVDESFAFHHVSFENPVYHPEWEGRLSTPQPGCQWGYLWEDGQLFGVTATDQKTEIDPQTLAPVRVTSTLAATNGKTYRINGEADSITQMQCWPNMSGHFALMRWDVDGRGVAWGDLQRCMWRDAWRMLRGRD